MNATSLFKQIMTKTPAEKTASELGLHPNTVRRWIEYNEVPEHYAGDFKRILHKNGDATDQFYTKTEMAKYCHRTFLEIAKNLQINVSKYHFIEPSAGCGSFYQFLPDTKRTGIDLHPLCKGIIKTDYLLWKPKKKENYIVIGNPPFGLRGHLALQFINHSAKFADIVAFILPQLFESDGKGVPSKRVNRLYRLAHSERLPSNSFVKPDGTPVNISTIFQVWTKINHQNITLEPRLTCKKFIKIYSLSNGGTPSSTRNKNMIGKCDLYLPSTCFNKMQAFLSFNDLPHRRGYGVVILKEKRKIKSILLSHDWQHTAFPSTNGAYNLRSSLIEGVVTKRGFCDER